MFEQVDHKKKALRSRREERREVLMAMKRQLDAEWTYQEMSIAGTPLARMDVRRMIETQNDPASRVKVLREAHNFHRATQFIDRFVMLSPDELGEAEVLATHAVLARGFDDRLPAQFRQLAPAEREPGRPVEGQEVAAHMSDLFQWLRLPSATHAIRQAVELHMRMMWVQPFVDMNGRMSRLMMNLVLMQRGLPPALLLGEERPEYLESVRHAADDGGISLARLVAGAVERSLDFCIEVVERSTVVAFAK